MLNYDQFTPLIEAAQATKDACVHDKETHLMSDKAFCCTFTARQHAYHYARKMAEATQVRAYANALTGEPGFGQRAERERIRAATLEAQAQRHREASEKYQETGDQLGSECLSIMRRKAPQAAPATPPAPQPPQAQASPLARSRIRPPPAGDGDGEGDGQ